MRKFTVSYDAYNGAPIISPSYRFVDFQMGDRATPRQVFEKAKKLVGTHVVAAVWEHGGDLIAEEGKLL